MTTGVPQGSIVGPTLYTLYTVELPEVIHQDEDVQDGRWPPYHSDNNMKKMTSCYADDTVITITAQTHAELEEDLKKEFEVISSFMQSQGLKLNDDKSHLLVLKAGLSREAQAAAVKTVLRTPGKTIEATRCEKFLGGFVQCDLKWTEHIIMNEENLCLSLNRRYNALKRISALAGLKSRKIFANGLFMSKLSYLISVWGGTTQAHINSLQVIQNKVARITTRNWELSTADQLGQLGWLSVNQLSYYQTVLQMYKLKLSRSVGGPTAPRYMREMFDWNYNYETRQATTGIVKPKGVPRLEVTRNSFRFRGALQFNRLPAAIIGCDKEETFKTLVKAWIKDNVPIRA